MRSLRLLGAACLIVAQSAALPARADAFLEPVGTGKIILTAIGETSGRYWGSDGKLAATSGYRKFGLSAHVEYGVAESLTLFGRQQGGALFLKPDAGGAPVAKGEAGTMLGARFGLFSRGPFVLSGEAQISGGVDVEGLAPGARGRGAAVELRLAAGASFPLLARPAFATLSIGPRIAAAASLDTGSGMRADVTFGVRPLKRVMVLLQSSNRFYERTAFAPRGRSHRLQASVVWDLTTRISIQAGVFGAVAGRAERRQTGALLAVWRKF